LAGSVDILPAVERFWVVVAAVASFHVDVKYEFDQVHWHDCSYNGPTTAIVAKQAM